MLRPCHEHGHGFTRHIIYCLPDRAGACGTRHADMVIHVQLILWFQALFSSVACTLLKAAPAVPHQLLSHNQAIA